MSHDKDMWYKVWMSKTPRGVGENFELMFMLLMNLWMAGCDKEEVSQL